MDKVLRITLVTDGIEIYRRVLEPGELVGFDPDRNEFFFGKALDDSSARPVDLSQTDSVELRLGSTTLRAEFVEPLRMVASAPEPVRKLWEHPAVGKRGFFGRRPR